MGTLPWTCLSDYVRREICITDLLALSCSIGSEIEPDAVIAQGNKRRIRISLSRAVSFVSRIPNARLHNKINHQIRKQYVKYSASSLASVSVLLI